MATRRSPVFSLRRLMNEVITVGDVVDSELQPMPATTTVADAKRAAAANGFDVIAVEGNRYVQRDVLDATDVDAPLGDVAQPIAVTDLVGSDLALGMLLEQLKKREFVFVLEGHEVKRVVTRADLNSPAVNVAVLSWLLAFETAVAQLVVAELGSAFVDFLSDEKEEEVVAIWDRQLRNNVDTGLDQCLPFGQWLTLLERPEAQALRQRLGFRSRSNIHKTTGAMAELRNNLAHGRPLLDGGQAPEKTLKHVSEIYDLTDRAWRLVDELPDQWTSFLATVITSDDGSRTWTGPRAESIPPGVICHVVTAWNPGGRIRPRSYNDQADIRLREQLDIDNRDYVAVNGTSSDGRWLEHSYMVSGLSRSEAVVYGESYQQAAVFELSDLEVRIVACPGGEVRGSRARR